VLEKLPLLALSIAASAVAIRFQNIKIRLDDGVWMPIHVRLANAVVAYVQYLGKLFWPIDLAALYPNPSHIGRPFWSAWHVAGAAAVLCAITLGAVAQRRRRPYLVVGWLWYLGTMVPVIGLVQVGRHSIADRYTYIPFIGLYVAIIWALADVTSSWRRRAAPFAVGASLVLAACFFLTVRQVRFWSDDLTLFEHGIAVTRDNWLFHNNAAATLEEQGRFDEAIDHMRAAVGIYEECAWLHAHLGTLYQSQDRLDEAQQELERSIALKPDYSDGYFYLKGVLTQRRENEQAIERFRRALEERPDDVESRRALAAALASLGRVDEAIEQLESGKQIRPSEAESLDDLIARLRSRKSSRSARTTDPST
jgi:hypothetical protein